MDKKIFYIMCCGENINEVTDEEWKYLSDKYTMSFAQFPFTGFKTKYFYSHEREYYDLSAIMLLAKRNYYDTILILTHEQSLKTAMDFGFKYIIPAIKGSALFLPDRRPWFLEELEPPRKFKNCRALTWRDPLFRVSGQLPAIINCALIEGATEIRLVGADMRSENIFLDTNPDRWLTGDLEKTLWSLMLRVRELRREIRKREIQRYYKIPEGEGADYYEDVYPKAAPPDRWPGRYQHSLVDLLQWMDKELREEGLDGIYVTNKNSIPYKWNKLQYRGIMDE